MGVACTCIVERLILSTKSRNRALQIAEDFDVCVSKSDIRMMGRESRGEKANHIGMRICLTTGSDKTDLLAHHNFLPDGCAKSS